ncbi:MAG TPA: hypothetical protein VES66_04480 [Terriglobales bacterium]|nr:hypothetical protein [Terriglobales bacterium]
MKPMRISMLAVLVSLMLWTALACGQGQQSAQRPQQSAPAPGLVPKASALLARWQQIIALQQIGSTAANGITWPMWAIRIGDTEAAEAAAMFWTTSSRYLGANSINGTVWVRGGEGWIKAIYCRPNSTLEFQDFVKDPAPFRSATTGGASILPFPFSQLQAKELQEIDFIVTYFDGGTKAYVQSGLSQDEAISLLQTVSRYGRSHEKGQPGVGKLW